MAVATMDNYVTTVNQIIRWLHCGRCLREMPVGESPSSWARLDAGVTEKGVQIWCTRHEVNVALIEWADAADKLNNPQPLDISCHVCGTESSGENPPSQR